jgi:hypothetical protein
MKRFLTFLLFLTSLLFFLPVQDNTQAAEGASLYLSPSVGVYSVGDFFSVTVKVDTGGVAINAAEAVIVFSKDKLDVVNVSKTGSIFALWTEEPTFSGAAGTVSFGGGLPSPGFTGSGGNLITITFKAKATGNALVSFSSGAVLANDGKGTNVLTNMRDGNYTIQVAEITPSPVHPTQVPEKPVVSSPTHPDPDKWYSNNNPEFNWDLPSDVNGVSLLLHKNAVANPGPISDGLMKSKKYENIEDGIWYFHIKFRNQYGWGQILHKKILIDTEPPKVFNIEIVKDDSTDPQPTLLFEVDDKTSGVDYYIIEVDGKEVGEVSAEEIEVFPYELPPQIPGKHIINVKAVDKAGNSTIATADVIIESIEPPKITQYPEKLQEGDVLIIGGTSLYPDSTVIVYLQKEDEAVTEGVAETDEKGNWLYVHEKSVRKGVYKGWAKVKDSRGALSDPSEEITITVSLPAIFKYGKIAIDYLTMIFTLIALIVFILLVIFYAWYRISVWRKRMRKETQEVAKSVTTAFRALRDEVEEQIAMLDKKPGLTKGEKEIRDKLQEALDISEKFIGKEIKDIEKELE